MKLPRRCLVLAAATLLLPLLSGCIRRQLTILSNPEGAQVELNGQKIGPTPVTVAFEWYGDYDVVLRYEKFEPGPDGKPVRHFYYLHTHQKTTEPAHQMLGVDLLTELSPFKFEDLQKWAFVVPEIPNPSDQEMIERGIDLRGQIDNPGEFRKPN